MTGALRDDGDVMRALGYVTLYSAYLEEGIDRLLERLQTLDEKTQRKPASQKVRLAKQLLVEKNARHLTALQQTLAGIKVMLERRNELVHGRFYAVPGGVDVVKSGRPGTRERPITSDELYQLATDLLNCQRELAFHSAQHSLERADGLYGGSRPASGAANK